MSRKTTKVAEQAINRHFKMMEHIWGQIQIKRTVALENQATYLQERTIDHLIGVARGYSACLEDLLHEQRCYHGFMHISFDPSGSMTYTYSGTNDWCRSYIIR